MRIGNRSFPYPVLNNRSDLSDYVPESTFSFKFDVSESGTPILENGDIVFKNLCFSVTDKTLSSLLEQGKVNGAFIVECSSSVYRNKFDISNIPQDLRIPASKIRGKVFTSCYLYATEEIVNFKSASFLEVYSGYSFDIDKFDILAVDDGFSFKIDFDPSLDDKVASIFTIIRIESSDDDIMKYDCGEKRIIISLPSKFYSCYENIKSKRECNNIAFSMLAIPVLADCMNNISKQYSSIEEIVDDYAWFNAVCVSYKRLTGDNISFEDFSNMNKLELAQQVLNSGTCNALKDFDNMLLGTNNSQDEDGED